MTRVLRSVPYRNLPAVGTGSDAFAQQGPFEVPSRPPLPQDAIGKGLYIAMARVPRKYPSDASTVGGSTISPPGSPASRVPPKKFMAARRDTSTTSIPPQRPPGLS